MGLRCWVRHSSKGFDLEDTLATVLPSPVVQLKIDMLQEGVQKDRRLMGDSKMRDKIPAAGIAAPIWMGSSLEEGKVYSHSFHQLVARPGLSLLD